MINYLIAIVFIVLTVYNIYYMRYFKRSTISKVSVEEKENYYKLDGKIELLKYLTLGLISVGAVFGINEFKDISDKYGHLEELQENYRKLSVDYQSLEADKNDLMLDFNSLKEFFLDYKVEKKNWEIEFLKQDQKIKEATLDIPENNIRILTKKLVESYIRSLTNEGMMLDGPDVNFINEEMKNMDHILRTAGYTPQEVDAILNEVRARAPWVFNKKK